MYDGEDHEYFNHIADPVQRNSVRQQWLQMVQGQLSISDLRVLLDKYPDFRFAVEKFVSNRVSKLDHSDSLKQIADILPEFKKLVNQRLETLRVEEEFNKKVKIMEEEAYERQKDEQMARDLGAGRSEDSFLRSIIP